MRIAGLILTAAVLGITGCGGADGTDETDNSDSSASDSNSSEASGQPPECAASDSIPQGASIELVLDDGVIQPGQNIGFVLQAPSEQRVISGAPFTIDRWNGERWKTVPGQPKVWTLQAYVIGSGSATPAQSWPDKGANELDSGWYRVTKSATYEGKRDVDLTAHGCFEVRG